MKLQEINMSYNKDVCCLVIFLGRIPYTILHFNKGDEH